MCACVVCVCGVCVCLWCVCACGVCACGVCACVVCACGVCVPVVCVSLCVCACGVLCCIDVFVYSFSAIPNRSDSLSQFFHNSTGTVQAQAVQPPPQGEEQTQQPAKKV